MTIDREALAAAIRAVQPGNRMVGHDEVEKAAHLVVAAARAHLATLPEKKRATLGEIINHVEQSSCCLMEQREAAAVLRAVEEFKRDWKGEESHAGEQQTALRFLNGLP